MSGIVNSTGSKSGIIGTTALKDTVSLTGTQTLTNKTITNPSGMDKNDVGLGNVDNVADASQTSVGALNAGSITSGFTSIDIGSGNLTATGTTTVTGTLVIPVSGSVPSLGTNGQVALGFQSGGGGGYRLYARFHDNNTRYVNLG